MATPQPKVEQKNAIPLESLLVAAPAQKSAQPAVIPAAPSSVLISSSANTNSSASAFSAASAPSIGRALSEAVPAEITTAAKDALWKVALPKDKQTIKTSWLRGQLSNRNIIKRGKDKNAIINEAINIASLDGKDEKARINVSRLLGLQKSIEKEQQTKKRLEQKDAARQFVREKEADRAIKEEEELRAKFLARLTQEDEVAKLETENDPKKRESAQQIIDTRQERASATTIQKAWHKHAMRKLAAKSKKENADATAQVEQGRNDIITSTKKFKGGVRQAQLQPISRSDYSDFDIDTPSLKALARGDAAKNETAFERAKDDLEYNIPVSSKPSVSLTSSEKNSDEEEEASSFPTSDQVMAVLKDNVNDLVAMKQNCDKSKMATNAPRGSDSDNFSSLSTDKLSASAHHRTTEEEEKSVEVQVVTTVSTNAVPPTVAVKPFEDAQQIQSADQQKRLTELYEKLRMAEAHKNEVYSKSPSMIAWMNGNASTQEPLPTKEENQAMIAYMEASNNYQRELFAHTESIAPKKKTEGKLSVTSTTGTTTPTSNSATSPALTDTASKGKQQRMTVAELKQAWQNSEPDKKSDIRRYPVDVTLHDSQKDYQPALKHAIAAIEKGSHSIFIRGTAIDKLVDGQQYRVTLITKNDELSENDLKIFKEAFKAFVEDKKNNSNGNAGTTEQISLPKTNNTQAPSKITTTTKNDGHNRLIAYLCENKGVILSMVTAGVGGALILRQLYINAMQEKLDNQNIEKLIEGKEVDPTESPEAPVFRPSTWPKVAEWTLAELKNKNPLVIAIVTAMVGVPACGTAYLVRNACNQPASV